MAERTICYLKTENGREVLLPSCRSLRYQQKVLEGRLEGEENPSGKQTLEDRLAAVKLMIERYDEAIRQGRESGRLIERKFLIREPTVEEAEHVTKEARRAARDQGLESPDGSIPEDPMVRARELVAMCCDNLSQATATPENPKGYESVQEIPVGLLNRLHEEIEEEANPTEEILGFILG